MSINEDTKLKKGKEKRKTGGTVGLYKYLVRAAKALVVGEPTVENSTVQYETVYAVTCGNLGQFAAFCLCGLSDSTVP